MRTSFFVQPNSVIFALGLLLSLIGIGGLDDLSFTTPFWVGASFLSAGVLTCYWQFRNWLTY